MKEERNDGGFSYVEVIVAMLLMTIGIMAMLSAITFAMIRERESDQRNTARQITSSVVESVFATRDLRNDNVLSNWDTINNNSVATPQGIFVSGWTPVRVSAGIDGIRGTADDACATGTNCTVGGYTNTSPEIKGFERRITITNIVESGMTAIRKKNVEISVRFYNGQFARYETVSTMIADLPFNN